MTRFPAVALTLLLAASLAGCTAPRADSSSDAGPMPMPVPGAVEFDGSTADGGTSSGGTSSGGVVGDVAGGVRNEDSAVGRFVITTGTVSVTVPDPFDAADEATEAVEAAGGRVDGRTEQAANDTDGGRATLTVRIPSTAFTATLDLLKDLGEVESVQLSSADVTMRAEDLDARSTALRASVDRLLALLAASDSTENLLKIENALSERQANLESLEAERSYLADQVSLTTITLALLSEGIAPPSAPDDFWAGVVAGFSGLVAALGAFAVGLGIALPWLVFVAALALVVLLIARSATRRRAAVATSAAGTQAGGRSGAGTSAVGTPAGCVQEEQPDR